MTSASSATLNSDLFSSLMKLLNDFQKDLIHSFDFVQKEKS